jgi:hypothetical protein
MTCFVYNEAANEQVDIENASNKSVTRRRRESRKQPTFVALDPELNEESMAEAEARDVSYQVLMRMCVVDGFRCSKRAG